MKKLENLTVKYINQNANLLELEELLDLLKSDKNQELFMSFIRVNYYSIYIMKDFDTDEVIRSIKQKIKEEKNISYFKKYPQKFLKYAAFALIFIGLGFYINLLTNQKSNEDLLVKKDEVLLQTSSGESFVLNMNQKEKIENKLNITQRINEIDYQGLENEDKDQFHTVIVPYGKRFNILLSDGTKVFLNSGSSLKYPVLFKDNETREVILDGEAYFEVVQSNQIFTVQSSEINVEVYGTIFNFRNYQEDLVSDVVLVEGSVGINSGLNNQIYKLSPGHKGSFFKDDSSITSERVNTSLYTSWIDGEIVIRSESFEQIVKKLERIYNVSIINNNESDGQLFNANINPDKESIEEVLMYFKEIYNIEYQVYENKIIIN
jgi:transmembrane sensor